MKEMPQGYLRTNCVGGVPEGRRPMFAKASHRAAVFIIVYIHPPVYLSIGLSMGHLAEKKAKNKQNVIGNCTC